MASNILNNMLFNQKHDDVGLVLQSEAKKCLRLMHAGAPRRNNCHTCGAGLLGRVNNFVSGLILLFERPIKRGDWIIVGNTEGYVKKISVRSTIIQTFDKSDVIVPNSELISSQVTNWMLHDIRGRVVVPVGVAYGRDTGLVKELMLEVANSHPRVITDGSVPKPRVLFMEFGDSSLNTIPPAAIYNQYITDSKRIRSLTPTQSSHSPSRRERAGGEICAYIQRKRLLKRKNLDKMD